MKDFEACPDPGCYVKLQIAKYFMRIAVLGTPKREPLNLEVICPHRYLCARCEAMFVTRVPDRTCVHCVIVPEIPDPHRCVP